MLADAFHLGEQIKLHTIEFKLYPQLWGDFDIDHKIMSELDWIEVKFLNDRANDFSEEVKKLPNDKGGVYIFIIKSEVLPNISEYLAYIGRAQLTEHHNLRVRCKRYLTTYINDKERPKITTLMHYYRDRLFLKYAIIEDNDLIIDIEAELINSLLPPFNDEIPEKRVRQAVDAF